MVDPVSDAECDGGWAVVRQAVRTAVPSVGRQ